MTKLSDRFTDYFQENHLCLPQGEVMMAKVLEDTMTEDVPEEIMVDGLLATFSAQLGAFLRGYLLGHNGVADFEDMLNATITALCPICLNHWALKRGQCCLGHALLHFMEEVYPDTMVSQLVSEAPSHGDPNLN